MLVLIPYFVGCEFTPPQLNIQHKDDEFTRIIADVSEFRGYVGEKRSSLESLEEQAEKYFAKRWKSGNVKKYQIYLANFHKKVYQNRRLIF